jgi:hypothetical protein
MTERKDEFVIIKENGTEKKVSKEELNEIKKDKTKKIKKIAEDKFEVKTLLKG